MSKLPLLDKNPFELVATDSSPEGRDRRASAAYLVLDNAQGTLK